MHVKRGIPCGMPLLLLSFSLGDPAKNIIATIIAHPDTDLPVAV